VLPSVEIIVPTRNRPQKLERCLEALGQAERELPFRVLVCDSSNTVAAEDKTRRACRQHPFVALIRHDRIGASAARNLGVRTAGADLVVTVDDDVYVQPDAIRRLVETYCDGAGWRVVGGSVAWGDDWSEPVVMRRIGYGRKATGTEAPSFLISAFLLCPRALALAFPWNERIRTSEDRFMGALWRSKGVEMIYASDARARHDPEHMPYGVDHQEFHIYANLFDALLANRCVTRALGYEMLGFAAGAKLYLRSGDTAVPYLCAWWRGHRRLMRDWKYLKDLVSQPLPYAPNE